VLFPPQIYPNGQQRSPQVGSLSVNFVVFRNADGFAVAFWASMSQVRGSMKVQLLPCGQQTAELESSKLIHVVDAGQQKFEGSFGSAQRVKLEGQSFVCRARSAAGRKEAAVR
jgi:hypothetical protein